MTDLKTLTLLLAGLFLSSSLMAGEGEQTYAPFDNDKAFHPPVLAVDSHTHLGPGTAAGVAEEMENWGLQRMVVLPPKDADFDQVMAEFGQFPDKYAVLYIPDFSRINERSWAKDIRSQVKHASELGAAGIKLYKDFSVYLRDRDGKLIPVDDKRFDPLWKAADEFDLPVLVHAGDPERFWMPSDDATNFIESEDWVFYGTDVPFRETILRQLEHVFARYPEVTFVGAHVGNRSEDPMQVAWLLDTYPNVYVDLSARYGELAKHTRETRWLLSQYADRILFGTDWGIGGDSPFYDGWSDDAARFYSRAMRILYTRDHTIPTPFDGNEGPLLVGGHKWAVDGFEIPEEILKTITIDTPNRIFFKGE